MARKTTRCACWTRQETAVALLPGTIAWRLSTLMFLQYAVPGALVPLLSLRLQELGFNSIEIGLTCATQSMAQLVGPLVMGQVADRWVPAERCLQVCAILSGTLLWILAGLTSWLSVFFVGLAFWLVMGPTITLGTSICFRHLVHPARQFGLVRMWGTVGWVVVNWFLTLWFGFQRHDLADIFRLGSILAFVLAGFALILPHTPPQRHAKTWLAPAAAVGLLRRPRFAVYCICTLGLSSTIPFSSQMTPLLLAAEGVDQKWLSSILTLGQSMEIGTLAALPFLLERLGLRATMFLGLLAQFLALSALTLGHPLGLVISALAFLGLCISCFVVAGQVFVNSQASSDIRASAQALLSCINASGLLLGNVLVGWIRGRVGGAFAPTFAVGLTILGCIAIGFWFGFHDRPSVEEMT